MIDWSRPPDLRSGPGDLTCVDLFDWDPAARRTWTEEAALEVVLELAWLRWSDEVDGKRLDRDRRACPVDGEGSV